MQEDILNALGQSEFFVGQRMKQLSNMIGEMISEFKSFCQKCESKLEINEVIVALVKLIKVLEKVFFFIEGPFSKIESKVFSPIKKFTSNQK